MDPKLCRRQNDKIYLAKTKHITSSQEKQNTWSNLLNKKSSINTTMAFKKKGPNNFIKTKTMSKSVQCDLPTTKICQSSTPLSVYNPIRILQFLLNEIRELPNIQNTSFTKIIGEMQVVVEKMIDEFPENLSYSKSHIQKMNGSSMIPTREKDYSNDLKFENSQPENKHWPMLLGKISELENNFSLLTKNYTKSEEKLLCLTSERDKLLEKYKESCDSLELLNNRERQYLDKITELKSKLMASEKHINQQENIITTLNKQLNNLPNKIQVNEFTKGNLSTEQPDSHKAVLEENNKLKNYNFISQFNMNESRMINNFNDNEVSKLKSDIKQMNKIVLNQLDDIDIKSVSMKSSKSESDQLKCSEKDKHIEQDIDVQYNAYNLQASVIKQAKTELQHLFETIKTQAYHSKKLFNSATADYAINLCDLSDEEDNCSNVSNFMSIVSDSSC